MVVVGEMATDTGIRGIVVIAIMAEHTLARYCCMSAEQRIIIVVVREKCRVPVGCRRMARSTIGWDV